jgi:DNA-binding response OmpR family regulator
MNAVSFAPVPLPRRKRILIVDDDTDSADALVQLLGDRYDTLVAGDGVEGAEKATTSSPDLIITDITMPRLDGLAMVRLVRARLSRKVPIIFLTGRDGPSDVVAGIGVGARHYLTKPVSADDLVRHIERALGI